MKYSKQMCLFKIFIGLFYIGATLRCARTTSKYDQPNYSTGEANLHRPGVKSSPCWVTTKNCRTGTTTRYERNTRVEHVQVRVAPGCVASLWGSSRGDGTEPTEFQPVM